MALGPRIVIAPAQRVTVIETPIREFAEWCEERSELSPETTYAVASLTALEGMSLFDNQLSDLNR